MMYKELHHYQDEIHKQRQENFCQLVNDNIGQFTHEFEWYVQMEWMKEDE